MRTREERKTKKKGQETTIGKIIYSFLLFLPLLAIGVTCGYAIFNKNAYKSYSDIQNSVTNTLTGGQTTEIGTTYTLNYTGGEYVTPQTYYVLDNKTNLVQVYDSQNSYEVNYFETYYETGRTRLIVFDTNNIQHNYFNFQNISNTFYFVANNQVTLPTTSSYYNLTYTTYNYAKVSDVFYYSIDKVTESPLFNWAENSIIYTTTASTCTALSITTPFIPLLMSYWLIISIIYFLYDIALMLVWIIHKKIHELQESI